jgi:hypothetical protein
MAPLGPCNCTMIVSGPKAVSYWLHYCRILTAFPPVNFWYSYIYIITYTVFIYIYVYHIYICYIYIINYIYMIYMIYMIYIYISYHFYNHDESIQIHQLRSSSWDLLNTWIFHNYLWFMEENTYCSKETTGEQPHGGSTGKHMVPSGTRVNTNNSLDLWNLWMFIHPNMVL